ncbi:hypothetical protein BABINDRAFT_98219 [Babjeviella inositovora NRRL Y-12698]|uniref:Uncharacterized protein n=1 Tax=Babjeviella inositovora NRRL Y-12698 TaxID=984486 RepID=A0A1E3QIA7_9ASCO|nr:uncharacterized protein BABINDRAFT_98219 [Babjeviella inositovora NRRL Y-12698]ODQ77431.1 hypothetical protein BABINDRAFT_98219 [Babjeviella inositovora NRRL Y-12698]
MVVLIQTVVVGRYLISDRIMVIHLSSDISVSYLPSVYKHIDSSSFHVYLTDGRNFLLANSIYYYLLGIPHRWWLPVDIDSLCFPPIGATFTRHVVYIELLPGTFKVCVFTGNFMVSNRLTPAGQDARARVAGVGGGSGDCLPCI